MNGKARAVVVAQIVVCYVSVHERVGSQVVMLVINGVNYFNAIHDGCTCRMPF
jgi:hypothetical protein